MVRRIINTICPRDCYSSCTMKVTTEDGRIVKVEGEGGSRATKGKLCLKGLSYIDYVYSENRIKYPMIREGNRGENKFKRVSWEYATDEICRKLNKIKADFGTQSLLFFSSGGCSGMLSDYYQGFFNQFGGYSVTRGNLCESAGVEALKLTYGDVLHNAPWDVENAGLIILWGKNPAYTNIHEMGFINNAVSKGCKLVTIDPVRNASSVKSDLHISPEPGTDMALALSIMCLLIERGSINMKFIDKYTVGFEKLREHVKKYTPSTVSPICGIDENVIYKLTDMIELHSPLSIICGFGMQRYKNGGQTVRAISIIPALLGDVGIKGGGFRFSNKQWKLKWPYVPECGDGVREGYTAASLGRAIKGFSEPEIKMLWIERANPLTMNPDINGLKNAMKELDYIVVIDQFFTDTACFADIVLPAQSFFEYEDIFRGYWSPYLNLNQKVIEPYYESKNESEIYRLLGEKMGYNMEYLPEYNDSTINKVLQYSKINTSVQELRKGPFMTGSMDVAFKNRKFNTPTGKIELFSTQVLEKWGKSPMPEYDAIYEKNNVYPLRFLSTHARERIHSQFGDIEKLKSSGGKAYIYMNPVDAEERAICEGDMVAVYNEKGKIYAYASVTDNIKKGVVNIYEGLPEKSNTCVNILTGQDSTDMGYGAAYYDCSVEVRKCQL